MLEKNGCQPKFVKMIRLLHLDMTGQILCSNDLLEAYAIVDGGKLSCVLAPVLFNLFFPHMLWHAVQNMNVYRLNTVWMTPKCLHKITREACVPLAHKNKHLQLMLDMFHLRYEHTLSQSNFTASSSSISFVLELELKIKS